MDLDELQRDIANYNKRNDLTLDARTRLLDLYSEVGELSKELLKGSNYGAEETSVTEDWHDELADCLYALISLANETDVHLEQSMQKVLQKYQRRLDEKGHAGSGK